MPAGWSSSTVPRILARDRHRCRICGQPATEVHHTRPGVETDDSLWSLCADCHRTVTQMQAASARWERAHAPEQTLDDAGQPVAAWGGEGLFGSNAAGDSGKRERSPEGVFDSARTNVRAGGAPLRAASPRERQTPARARATVSPVSGDSVAPLTSGDAAGPLARPARAARRPDVRGLARPGPNTPSDGGRAGRAAPRGRAGDPNSPSGDLPAGAVERAFGRGPGPQRPNSPSGRLPPGPAGGD